MLFRPIENSFSSYNIRNIHNQSTLDIKRNRESGLVQLWYFHLRFNVILTNRTIVSYLTL